MQFAQCRDLLVVSTCTDLEDLLSASRRGSVDCVLLSRLSGLGNTLDEVITALEQFRQAGIGVITIEEGINTVAEPSGLFQVHVAMFANIQREMAEQRTFSQAEGPRERRESLLPTDVLR